MAVVPCFRVTQYDSSLTQYGLPSQILGRKDRKEDRELALNLFLFTLPLKSICGSIPIVRVCRTRSLETQEFGGSLIKRQHLEYGIKPESQELQPSRAAAAVSIEWPVALSSICHALTVRCYLMIPTDGEIETNKQTTKPKLSFYLHSFLLSNPSNQRPSCLGRMETLEREDTL